MRLECVGVGVYGNIVGGQERGERMAFISIASKGF
jgi:hypothetical protein